MCGITAMFCGETIPFKDKDAYSCLLHQACLTGMLRGEDSTGLFQVDKNNSVIVVKSPIDGYHFRNTRAAKKALAASPECFATVIHNRASTKGGVSYENCHPFQHISEQHDITAVHNGTVMGFRPGFDYQVDSDYLINKMAVDGPVKALSEIDGASFAMIWWDGVTKRLNIATDGNRPMHWAMVKKSNIMLMASEDGMLRWLAERNGIELDTIYYAESHTIYTFDPTNSFKNYETTAIPKIKRKPTTLAVVSSWAGYTHLKEEKKRIAINDFFGEKAFDKSDMQYKSRVDFQADWPGVTGGKNRIIVYGSAHPPAGAPMRAMMFGIEKDDAYKMAKAGHVYCKTQGIRRVVDVKSGEASEILICMEPEIPAQLVDIKGDEIVGLEELAPIDADCELLFIGHDNKEYTEKEFNSLIKDGCCFCSCDLDINKAASIEWLTGNSPMCTHCASQLSGA